MFLYLIKGILIGLSIAAPAGPIGLLCIKKSLTEGMRAGFISGLGAATADGIYGIVASLGLTIVSSFLVSHKASLAIIEGTFLLYLGIKTFTSPVATKEAVMKGKGYIVDYFSTLGLTITNPLTILSFAAIFAGLGIGNTKCSSIDAISLIFGVFLGSALWWLALSSIIHIIGKKVERKSLNWINKASGIVIITFGIIALVKAI